MFKQLSIWRCTLVGLFASLVSLHVIVAGQQTGSSLTDLDFEKLGEKPSPETITAENNQLRAALSRAEQTVRELRQAHAAASGEVEIFKRQALDIKKRFEALGSGVGGESKRLEERLLASVSELQQLEEKNIRLVGAIGRLTDAINRFSLTVVTEDGNARLALEGAMRASDEAVGLGTKVEAKGVPPSLDDGLVISVRDELMLVVTNLGRPQGAKVGMPFRVIRGNALVGTVRIVDVREKFSGAIIQNLSSEENRIHIGDRLKIEVQP